MKKILLFLSFCGGLILVGASVFAQTTISYAPQTNVYTYGTAISSLMPNTTGSPTGYTINIPLPAGLNFDTSTGIISGTPTAVAPATDYIVTATDGAGISSGTFDVNIAVNPAPLTITANPQTKNYGTTFTFAGTEFTTSGLLFSDAVTSATITSAGSVATATVAGSTYPIIPAAAVGSGLSNYNIVYANGAMTVSTVTLTITANPQTKNYGTMFAFAGTEFTTAGLLNSDAVTSATITSAGSVATATVAGSTYPIIPAAAVGSGLSNYNIVYANGAMTVSTVTLTITANPQTKNYGTMFAFAGTEFTTAGLLNSDAVTSATITSAGSVATATVAGSTYPIIPAAAVGSGLSNYNIVYANGAMTVSTVTLTITANPQTKNYGTTFTFAGTEFTTAGLLNSDAVTGATITSAGSVATATVAGSTYPIIPGAAVGSGLSNYNIVYANGAMTVSTVTLTITANPQTKNYGTTFAFAGTEFTTSGLLFSDAVTSATITSAGSVATATVAGSTYPIIPAAAVGSGLSNYNIVYANGAMTVNTVTLTVTANPQTKNYGTTFTFAGTEFTTAGLLNSDAVTGATITSAGSVATATVAGSTYPIIPAAAVGSGLSNYNIVYANGAMTVSTVTLTITANPQTKNYGTTFTFAGTEFTTAGLLNSDAVTSATITSAGSVATATVAGSTYPIIPAAAVGSGLSNYNIVYANGAMTVSTVTLTITANPQTKNYGTTFTFAGTEFTTAGLLNSDAVTSATITSAGSVATATVAGSTYPIIPAAAVGSGLSNYNIVYANGAMTVSTVTLTITANPQTKNYGTTFAFAGTEFTTAGLLNSDAVTSATITSAGSVATATVAGSTYPIIPGAAVGSGLSNYNIVYANGAMTVSTVTLTITANPQTKNYGTTFTFAGTEFTTSGLLNSDAVTGATITSAGSVATATVAGSTYPIIPAAAVGSGLSNYNIVYANGAMTVSTVTLTITANPQTKNYGTTFAFAGTEFTTAGLLNSDAVTSATITSAGSVATATVAGSTYPIIPGAAVGSGLSNYNIVYANGAMTVSTVTLTITANPQTKNYGTTFTFAGTEFTTSGLLNSDAVTGATITSAGSVATATVAGSTYPIIPAAAVGSGLSNYNIVYANGAMTVSTVTLTITANPQTKNYGTTFAFAGTEFTTAGLLNSDAVTGATITSAGSVATATVAGSTYPIIPGAAVGSGLSNYNIVYANGAMTVSTVTLTITANPQTKNYGTTFTFAGTEFTTSGLLNSDAVTGATITSAGSVANATVAGSTYPIIPAAAVGSGLSNYNIVYANGAMTVNTVTLTITATSLSKNYGAVNPTLAVTYSGFVSGDTPASLTTQPTISTTALTGSPVGSYPITASGAVDANYAISYVAGTLTVGQATLTITATGPAKSYGTALTAGPTGANFTVSAGLVAGQNVTSVTLTPDAAGLSSTTAAGLPYVVTPSLATGTGGFLASNYNITYTPFNGTVTAKALTITATGPAKTYGTALTAGPTGLNFTAAGTIAGENVTSVTLTPNAAGLSATTAAGLSYVVTPSLATGTGGFLASNYNITYTPFNGTVTQAVLTITATGPAKAYGTALTTGPSGSNFTITGTVVVGTLNSVTLTPNAAGLSATTAAGLPYVVTPSAATGTGGFLASNYNITYTPFNGTVAQAALTITATGPSKTYGTALTTGPSGTNFTITGTVVVGTLNSVTLTPNAAGLSATTAAGLPYVVTPSAATGNGGFLASNYNITYTPFNGTVAAKALTITATGPAKTYGTALTAGTTGANFTVSAGGLIAGQNVNSVTLTPNAAGLSATTAAGTGYTVTPSLATGTGGFLASNYNITYTPFNGTVAQEPLTIALNNANKTYGATLTGAAGSTAFTSTGLIGSETIGSVTITYTGGAGSGALATANVNTYANQVSGSLPVGGTFNVNNYAITYNPGDIIVGQAALTITANTVNKTYGTALTGGTGSAAFTPTGLQNSQTIGSVTITYTGGAGAGAAATANVGTYNNQVTPSAATGGTFTAANYTITYATGNIIVGQKALTITATGPAKTYGTALTAGTTGANFTVSAGGLIAGQNVNSVTLTPNAAGLSATTAAGTGYTVTPSLATGTGGFLASNYNITYTPFNGTVAQEPLTIALNNANKTYGATLTGAAGSTAFTSTGLIGSETIGSVTITYTGGAGSGALATANVNTYANQVSGSLPVGGTFNVNNYAITYNPGDIIVGQATLNAKANNATRAYGAANPTFTFTYTGFQNGDTQAVLNTQPTGATTATATSAPGTYTITGSGGVDNNYTFTYTSGTLTVTQAALTITAVSQTRTLGVASALTLTYTGFQNGETSANLTTQPTETTTATAASPVGSYPITVCCAADANYAITYVAGTLTITAAGSNAYDWTGIVSTAWNNPQNWEINNFQQTVNYPGSSSNADIANVGVNTAIPIITNYPIISVSNINIATLTFGNNNAPQNTTGGTLALTVNNGLTLAVSGAILQEHSNTGNSGGLGGAANGIVTTLQGSGFITCGSFTVGDNTLPANFGNTITRVNIGGAAASTLSVTVNGNLTMNSASQGFIIGINASDAYLSLGAGTLTVTGTVQLTNFNTGFTFFNLNGNPYAKLSIDLNNTNSPILNLLGATPVSIANQGNANYNNLVDFNNPVTTPNKTGTVNYGDGTGTQKVYASADANFDVTPAMYSILTLSNASAKTVDGGTLSTTSDFNSSGGAVSLNTNNPIVTVGGNWTNTATVAEGTGAVGVTGNLVNNAGGVINGDAAATATTTITGSATNAGTLTCNKENLVFNGNYTNTATFTAGTGLVSFTGAAAQSLQDNSTTGTTFNNVTFGSTTAKTMSGTGFFAVSSTGLLTMASTATLATGGILTLNSDINGSANVAQITSGKPITGNVNVQRFITGIRSYRLLSSPVSTSLASGIISMNYLINSCFITGTTGASGGFDTFPGSPNNPSLYLFRENLFGTNASFTSSNYRGVNNLTTAPSYGIDVDSPPNFNVYDGNGYLFFFRGDRNIPGQTLATENPGYVPTNTTLTATGALNQGAIPVKQWYTGATALLETTLSGNVNTEGFNLVGNPYASSINWDTYSTTVSTSGIYAPGVASFLYILMPNGNYNVYTANPTGSHQSTGGIPNSNVISSGQGFFVIATGASPSLTFNETAKTTAQVVSGLNGNLFLGDPPQAAVSQYIHILMAKDSLNEEGILINFNSTASAKFVRGEDAPYKVGSGPGNLYCMSADSIPVAINTLQLPKLTPDIIPLYVSATTDGTYNLNMAELKSIPEIYDVWLKDAHSKDSVNLRSNPSYSFNILRSDATTYGPKRFTVVIGEDTARNVHLLSFNATKATNGAEVVWKTRNESNYTYFTVERSNDDGKTFVALGGSVSNSLGTYSFLDKTPPVGADRYRLKIEDLNGTITYSNIVTLIFNKSTNNDINASNIIVYPNPTSGKVDLTINQTTVAAEYTIQITNNVGTVIKTGSSSEPFWEGNLSELMPGTYFITVISKKDSKLVGRSAIVKL